MNGRKISHIDSILSEVGSALRTLSGTSTCRRNSPANGHTESKLSKNQITHIAGLMRVNHAGEICAQALYQGQSVTAELSHVREEMEKAAEEEIDHLVWCEARLKELGSTTSILNPLWYGLSFGIGVLAGKMGDKVSLGFVAATEERVAIHLRNHLDQLPEEDRKSRLILQQMLVDEEIHGRNAIDFGGLEFARPIKKMMAAISLLMTKTSYWI